MTGSNPRSAKLPHHPPYLTSNAFPARVADYIALRNSRPAASYLLCTPKKSISWSSLTRKLVVISARLTFEKTTSKILLLKKVFCTHLKGHA